MKLNDIDLAKPIEDLTYNEIQAEIDELSKFLEFDILTHNTARNPVTVDGPESFETIFVLGETMGKLSYEEVEDEYNAVLYIWNGSEFTTLTYLDSEILHDIASESPDEYAVQIISTLYGTRTFSSILYGIPQNTIDDAADRFDSLKDILVNARENHIKYYEE